MRAAAIPACTTRHPQFGKVVINYDGIKDLNTPRYGYSPTVTKMNEYLSPNGLKDYPGVTDAVDELERRGLDVLATYRRGGPKSPWDMLELTLAPRGISEHATPVYGNGDSGLAFQDLHKATKVRVLDRVANIILSNPRTGVVEAEVPKVVHPFYAVHHLLNEFLVKSMPYIIGKQSLQDRTWQQFLMPGEGQPS